MFFFTRAPCSIPHDPHDRVLHGHDPISCHFAPQNSPVSLFPVSENRL